MHDPLVPVVGAVPPDFRLRNLERARLARGWTREELADRSGVAAETVKKQERGSSPATLETAWRLSKALGLAIDVLLLPIASGEAVRATVRKRRRPAATGP